MRGTCPGSAPQTQQVGSSQTQISILWSQQADRTSLESMGREETMPTIGLSHGGVEGGEEEAELWVKGNQAWSRRDEEMLP